jgi:hypothetical protein
VRLGMGSRRTQASALRTALLLGTRAARRPKAARAKGTPLEDTYHQLYRHGASLDHSDSWSSTASAMSRMFQSVVRSKRALRMLARGETTRRKPVSATY